METGKNNQMKVEDMSKKDKAKKTGRDRKRVSREEKHIVFFISKCVLKGLQNKRCIDSDQTGIPWLFEKFNLLHCGRGRQP